MTQHHIHKRASAVALGVCICGTAFTALTTHGAVSVTASRDYVDRKFATATNLIEGVSGEVEKTYTTVTNLVEQKQDKLNDAELAAVGSGITSSKVSQYDVVAANYLSASSNTLTSAGVVTEYLAQNQSGAIVGGVRVRYSSVNHDNETSYLYNGVAVKRNGVNSDYLWDTNSTNGVVRRQELGYYVTKSELTELVTAIVTNLMGNVYWNSSDGGQTIDAYWRDGAEVSNIVNQVNAYLRLENGRMSVYTDSSNVPATEDDGNDGNESEE